MEGARKFIPQAEGPQKLEKNPETALVKEISQTLEGLEGQLEQAHKRYIAIQRQSFDSENPTAANENAASENNLSDPTEIPPVEYQEELPEEDMLAPFPAEQMGSPEEIRKAVEQVTSKDTSHYLR